MHKDLETTTYKQIFMLGILILVGLLVFGAVGMAIAQQFWSPEDIAAATSYILENNAQVNYMKLLQFLTMFGTFLFPAIALNYLAKSKDFSFLYLNKSLDINKIIVIVGLVAISLPIINALMAWNQTLHLPESMANTEAWMREKEALLTGLTETFMLTSSFGGLIINLLLMAVLPAFGEEFIFRGILMKWFSKSMSIHLAIIISAFIFSAIHIQFLGFFPRFFMGLILGYVFYWSGSLWASILLHFLNNGMTVVSYFLLARGLINDDPASMGSLENTAFLMADILLFIGLMYWFYRNRVNFKL